MKRDYSELEGKEILYKRSDDSHIIGIVLFCDPHIGITIVDKEDKDHYLICYKGPLAPQWKDKDKSPTYPKNPEKDKVFIELVKAIEEGEYNTAPRMEKLSPLALMYHSNPTVEDCPFGQ